MMILSEDEKAMLLSTQNTKAVFSSSLITFYSFTLIIRTIPPFSYHRDSHHNSFNTVGGGVTSGALS
jgi:hypothetical protein